MISEEIKNLKRTYKNSLKGEKIGRDLISPCLSECTTYRRGTGTFTSSILKTYLESIEHIFDDDVKIEILCSPKIDNILFQSIKAVSDEKKKAESIQNFLDNFIYDITGVNKKPQGRVGERAGTRRVRAGAQRAAVGAGEQRLAQREQARALSRGRRHLLRARGSSTSGRCLCFTMRGARCEQA